MQYKNHRIHTVLTTWMFLNTIPLQYVVFNLLVVLRASWSQDSNQCRPRKQSSSEHPQRIGWRHSLPGVYPNTDCNISPGGSFQVGVDSPSCTGGRRGAVLHHEEMTGESGFPIEGIFFVACTRAWCIWKSFKCGHHNRLMHRTRFCKFSVDRSRRYPVWSRWHVNGSSPSLVPFLCGRREGIHSTRSIFRRSDVHQIPLESC